MNIQEENKLPKFKVYEPTAKDLIRINLMLANYLPKDFIVKENSSSHYISVTNVNDKSSQYFNWFVILYGYLIPHIIEVAWNEEVIDGIDECVSMNENFSTYYLNNQQPPINDLWELFLGITSKLNKGVDLNVLVDIKTESLKKKDHNKYLDQASDILINFNNQSNTPNTLVLPEKKESKIIVINNKKETVSNYSQQIL